MKKITLLLTMLVVMVATAMAQVTEGQMYRLKETLNSGGKYLTIKEQGQQPTGAKGSVALLDKAIANDDQIFYFETASDGGYKLKSKSNFYIKHHNWNVNNTVNGDARIELVDNGDNTYKIKNLNANKFYKSQNVGGIWYPFCDAPEDIAATWVLETVNESEFSNNVTVKYIFKDSKGIERLQSQETVVAVGAAYPAITVAMPYGVTASVPAGTVSKEGATDGVIEIEIELVEGKLPFVAAASADEITNWYYMQMHWNNKKYVNANETAIEWAQATVPADNKDAYTWGFVGNIWDGFKVVNYGAMNKEGNTSTTLTWNNGTSLGGFGTAHSFNCVHTGWSAASAESFCLEISAGIYLNAQGTTVKSWNDDDAGSTITLTERPVTVDALSTAAYAKLAEMEALIGDAVGFYKQDVYAELAIAVGVAESAARNNGNIALLETVIDQINAALTDAKNINMPVAGEKYFITSGFDGFYTNQGVYKTMYAADEALNWGTKTIEGAGHYWEVYPIEGGYAIKNCATGLYINGISFSENEVASTLNFVGDTQFNIVSNNNTLHANYHGSGTGTGADIVNHGSGKNNASSWKFVKATDSDIASIAHTLSVGETLHATLCLGFNTTIPTGVKCYIANDDNLKDGGVKLVEVKDVLPANVPVIVIADVAGEYNFVYTTKTATVSNNMLEGTLYTKDITPVEGTTYYVLAIGDDGVGLYPDGLYDAEGNKGAGTFRNNANKAYLPVKTTGDAALSAGLRFEFGTTGIENVESIVENAVYYDLSGRRVENPVKGLYIVNGKKVLVK